jgi:hypothetical protein
MAPAFLRGSFEIYERFAELVGFERFDLDDAKKALFPDGTDISYRSVYSKLQETLGIKELTRRRDETFRSVT